MYVTPRLDRHTATAMLERLLTPNVEAITSAMPDLSPVVTYAPAGGSRISEEQLRELRTAILHLAVEYGLPRPLDKPQEFEGHAARLVHRHLPMTAHEFAHEEVWNYITCCWLLDVAVWRFGHDADRRRFIGHVNRNTFRRMWWRADVLGTEVDLTQLGEDELVNITERPTVAADRRLARTVAHEFLARVDRGEAASRMLLMREAMKRLLRLTPFVSFATLDDDDLSVLVEDIFNAAAAGLSGQPAGIGRHRRMRQGSAIRADELPSPSAGVVAITRLTIPERPDVAWSPPHQADPADDFETVAQAALDIAQRAGRVTNEGLRDIVAISAEEARHVLRTLVARGALVRRGVKRGTHYMIPEQVEAVPDASPPGTGAEATDSTIQKDIGDSPLRIPDSALRRLLRRGR